MRKWTVGMAAILLGWSGLVLAADFNGDGTNEIGIFRPSSGLWAIRGVTRAYFGTSGDVPMPGDYNGDGTVDIALFRPNSGLWAVRGVTRSYFGASADTPLIGVSGRGFSPIAHGSIYYTGSGSLVILWGSGNFSVEWTAESYYDIVIQGHSYNLNSYMTLVSPLNLNPIIATTDIYSGKLRIRTFNTAGTKVASPFHFVVYKK